LSILFDFEEMQDMEDFEDMEEMEDNGRRREKDMIWILSRLSGVSR
jgi:hypothetical protein